jgi:glycyl-tRNA synthetase
LRIPAALALVKAAVFPLLNKDGLPEKAQQVFDSLKFDHNIVMEEKDAIGKRYRRQDAIGTPLCITVDHQTLEDNTVTIRHRDSMQQDRIPIDRVVQTVTEICSLSGLLRKLA